MYTNTTIILKTLDQEVHKKGTKWLFQKRDIQFGDVLLKKNIIKIKWPLARVMEVIPSKYGHVRFTGIKTSKDIYFRNITKLLKYSRKPNLYLRDFIATPSY